ncbi:hypothetical protein MTO96_049357 [Rhipicephalus appendiculatus]
MTRSVNNCVVTLVSNLTSPWSAEWYRTNGQDHLFKSAVAALQPFLALTKELSVNDNLQSLSVIPGHYRRLQACLRLTESYDSASLSSLGASVLPPALQREAKESLRVLNKALGETLPSAPSIKFKLGQPPRTTTSMRQALRPKYASGNDSVNASTTGDSKLMKLLRATTWDKWTNPRGRNAVALAFSTMPNVRGRLTHGLRATIRLQRNRDERPALTEPQTRQDWTSSAEDPFPREASRRAKRVSALALHLETPEGSSRRVRRNSPRRRGGSGSILRSPESVPSQCRRRSAGHIRLPS